MTKILFIIPYIPYPLDSGGNQAFFNMVDHIRNYMDVSILLYPKHHDEKVNIKKLQEKWDNVSFLICKTNKQDNESIIKHPFYFKMLNKAKRSLERKMRRQVIQTNNDESNHIEKDFVKDIVKEKSTIFFSIFERLESTYIDYINSLNLNQFDIIQVEFFELLSLGYILPKNVKKIFVHHELRYVRNENELSLFKETNVEDKLLLSIAKDYEKNALLQFDNIIALSETDKIKLSDFLGRGDNIFVSPAVVKPTTSQEDDFVPSKDNILTFVGSEYHYPNLDAVNWFCRDIAPILRKRNFNFSFQLIGKWNSSYMLELKKICKELDLVGYVDNLSDKFKGSISIIPIRIGSGIRMKILDTVCLHTPFVTTTKGVEGLDLRNREECLIADSEEDFADAIIELAKNEELQFKFATNAHDRLKSMYNPNDMLQKRMDIYSTILSKE